MCKNRIQTIVLNKLRADNSLRGKTNCVPLIFQLSLTDFQIVSKKLICFHADVSNTVFSLFYM